MNEFITELPELGVITAEGADAGVFLQSQLTSDINGLGHEASGFSAWCDPQGRVIANFIVYRDIDRFLLLVSSDLGETVCQRLNRYVLRARASLSPGGYRCTGVAGTDSLAVLAGLPPALRSVIRIISLPSQSDRRWVVAVPTASNESLQEALASQNITGVDPVVWDLMDIETGVAWITGHTSGKVLPQELNLDTLGGLSYKKGCYPGQEVIARLHYRGRTGGRKLYACSAESRAGLPAPGSSLYRAVDTNTSGILLSSARYDDEHIKFLAAIRAGDAEAGPLYLAGGEVIRMDRTFPPATAP